MLSSPRLKYLGSGLLVIFLMAVSTPAWADIQQDGDEEVTGSSDGPTIDASAGVARITYTPAEPGPGSGPSVGATSWSPPACYYAPTYSPEEFQAYWDELSREFYNSGHLPEDKEALRQSLEDSYGEDGEYPNFNVDRQGEGMFWQVVRNDNHPDADARWACESRTFWVDFGDPPPADVPEVVDVEMLAELAYERIRVPDTEIEMNPGGAQTVNLATWVWLRRGEFEPVSVTASLDDYGLSATTTATPVGLTIEPGTGDAVTHPGSGECAIDAAAYREGAEGHEPPCGVTYLRSTPEGGAYELTASVRWEIAWEGSDGSGGTLPDGVFETTYDVTVDEVQTIVR
ncbi:hypothetical protein [Streptomyces triticirhizae]|uniref:Enoyl reductase n=1 Tax=Streptomyces triticirhizae TaxID=2483353 RepID=A0A3M2M1M4_9ACTN|nr:hypothetical protein [Streptomyces triticirhizae]RMI42783.1 hypothetical protein EBN88_08630 [Streptomyces triticirhizae]